MCYYKLDYYDVSLEILAVYLQAFPDSAVAVNLKVCEVPHTGRLKLRIGIPDETEYLIPTYEQDPIPIPIPRVFQKKYGLLQKLQGINASKIMRCRTAEIFPKLLSPIADESWITSPLLCKNLSVVACDDYTYPAQLSMSRSLR